MSTCLGINGVVLVVDYYVSLPSLFSQAANAEQTSIIRIGYLSELTMYQIQSLTTKHLKMCHVRVNFTACYLRTAHRGLHVVRCGIRNRKLHILNQGTMAC